LWALKSAAKTTPVCARLLLECDATRRAMRAIRDEYFDQMRRSGHWGRIDDLDLFAGSITPKLHDRDALKALFVLNCRSRFILCIIITKFSSNSLAELLDQSGLVAVQLAKFLAVDAGVFTSRSHDSFILILDSDGDEPVQLQVGNIGLNLALADSEEFGKISVRSVTTALVVERMDFDEQHFFHD
jgi:hypothetical protein